MQFTSVSFLLFAAVLAAVTVMYQFIINAAHKKRKQVEEAAVAE